VTAEVVAIRIMGGEIPTILVTLREIVLPEKTCSAETGMN